MFGGGGRDNLFGGFGFDALDGGASDDLIRAGTNFGNSVDGVEGGAGNDLIDAGGGNDTIGGGAGFDTIIGGAGNDLMFGDLNADTFVFADGHGQDTIGDFEALNDLEKIDLSGVSAISSLDDLDLGSTTNGAATQAGADVLIDTGNGNSIRLTGVNLADLGAGDFIF